MKIKLNSAAVSSILTRQQIYAAEQHLLNQSLPYTSGCIRYTPQEDENKSCEGVDIPTWITKPDANRGCIAVIAQDPLRKLTDFPYGTSKTTHILIGTPFASHDPAYRTGKRGIQQAWDALNYLFGNYDLYLTDLYKTWPNREPQEDAVNKLREEMKQVKPELIVVFGRQAAVGLGILEPKQSISHIDYKLYETPLLDGTLCLPIVHPSSVNIKHHLEAVEANHLMRNSKYIQLLGYALGQLDETNRQSFAGMQFNEGHS